MQHIPMSIEEYHLHPRQPGLKYEYWDGAMHISAAATVAVLSVPTRNRPHHEIPHLEIRPPCPADEEALVQLHAAAFAGTVDYFRLSETHIAEQGRREMRCYFAGERGAPLAASRVACRHGDSATLVGATLIVRQDAGSLQDLLMVHPAHRQQGIASAMVALACAHLAATGEATLWSLCHLGNTASMAWHTRFGFVEEPDMLNTRRRLHHVRHDRTRLEAQGELDETTRKSLKAEEERLLAELQRLENLIHREGYKSAAPLLRWR